MKRCPITYEVIDDKAMYSQKGLKQLSSKLTHLKVLNYTQNELTQEALQRKTKMSVQGIQTKLSARLHIKDEAFELVDFKGQYILKPQSVHYPELPENEALTMSLAKLIGIEVPVHGLLYGKDNKLTYFIKRFDRVGHNKKIAVEDFAQLSISNRNNKYKSSMEQIAKIIEYFCSVPRVEFVKLFRIVLFNYLTGNEDAHLKNFSLMTRNNLITLTPAYDLLNTTIAGFNKEQIALPLNKRKNNLRKKDLIDYYAYERLQLNEKVVSSVLSDLQKQIPSCLKLIENSFLSLAMKENYSKLLQERLSTLEL